MRWFPIKNRNLDVRRISSIDDQDKLNGPLVTGRKQAQLIIFTRYFGMNMQLSISPKLNDDIEYSSNIRTSGRALGEMDGHLLFLGQIDL